MLGIVHHARGILRRVCFNSPRLLSARNMSQVDEDGDVSGQRTNVSFLNDAMDGLAINGFSQLGFLLNNGIRVIGPCAVFPRSILQWNVKDVEDISEESLSLFTMLEPKLVFPQIAAKLEAVAANTRQCITVKPEQKKTDILILGVGNYDEVPKLNKSIVKHLLSHKISVEVLSTEQAVSTFNFLNEEKRYVAGAFIPPTKIEMPEEEAYLPEDHVGAAEYDMMIVMRRMAKLRGHDIGKLPDPADDEQQQ